MLIGVAKPPDPLLAPVLEPAQKQDRKFQLNGRYVLGIVSEQTELLF